MTKLFGLFQSAIARNLQVAALGVGIGGALLQYDQLVALYSNTLTETEQR